MGTPTRERVRAYRARLREQGGCRLSVTLLDAEARTALDTLRAQYPDQSIDRIISDLLAGRIPLPCNNSPLSSPLPCNSQPLPCNGFPLPGNSPQDRQELAVIGHQWRQEGATLEDIAERFNARGWTPALIPKRAGAAPRADSALKWTDKAVSQLLNRDYPRRD